MQGWSLPKWSTVRSGPPLLGKLLALPTNIILGWKSLPGTNTLAQYENSYITAVKSFITLSPGANVIKKFWPKFTNYRTKLECLLEYTEKLARDKHSSSVRKFVHYGCKKFYNIEPRLSTLRVRGQLTTLACSMSSSPMKAIRCKGYKTCFCVTGDSSWRFRVITSLKF